MISVSTSSRYFLLKPADGVLLVNVRTEPDWPGHNGIAGAGGRSGTREEERAGALSARAQAVFRLANISFSGLLQVLRDIQSVQPLVSGYRYSTTLIAPLESL